MEALSRVESLLSEGRWNEAQAKIVEYAALFPIEEAGLLIRLAQRLENRYRNDFFSRNALEGLFNDLVDPCVIADEEGRVVMANPKAVVIFRTKDFFFKPLSELLSVPRLDERIKQRKKGFVEFYLPFVKRYYEADFYPFGAGTVLFFRDVTLQKNSERALIVNDRNLKAILNSGGQAYFLLDVDGVVQTANKNATLLMNRFGVSLSRKARLSGVFPKTFFEAFEHGFERAKNGKHFNVELDLSGETGRPLFLHLDFNPVVETGKRIVAGVCLCVNDVTEAKQAQIELQKSETRFRSVVQNALDGIAIFDDERRIKYAGPSFLRLLGIERAMGFRFSGFLPEAEKDKFEAAWNAAMNQGYFRLELFTRAGRYLDVILSHLPLEGMVFNARDVTEKKQAEERLLLLREAVRHASDAIVITEGNAASPSGGPKILFVNPSFETINGRTSAEVIGKAIGEVFDEKLAKLFDSDSGGRLNAAYVRPDSTTYEVEWAVAPLSDEHGNVVRKIAVQRDATERNALQRQTLEKERAVLQALINGQELERKRISEDLHDGLGSVLSVLKMSFSVLKSQIEENSQAGDGTQLIGETLRRIEAQLDAAAEEARNISSNLSPGILNDFGLVKAVEALKQRIETSTKIRVEFKHSGWDEYGRLLGSENLIGVYRVLQEILNNAVKHSFASRILIELTLTARRLSLIVADDGVGFDKNRVPKDRKGMGLSNIHTRILLLKGKSKIVSKPGRGTMVSFSLPLSANKPLVNGK